MAKKVDVDWAAFRALVLSGLAIRDVARRLGVNPNTALARAKRDKWQVAKSHGHGRKPDIPKEALARTERTLQAGKDFIAQADTKTKFHLAKAVVSASQTLSKMPGQHIIDNHQALHSVAKTAAGVFHWDAEHLPSHLSIQGLMFCIPPDQLAAHQGSFDELAQQYSDSHSVRDLDP